MDVSAQQTLAFRLAAQRLADPAASVAQALGGWTVQDSPPGAAAAAVLNRVESLEPGAIDAAIHDDRSAVALYNARTAVAVVPAADAAAYGTGMLPADDAGLRAIVANAVPEQREGFAAPVELGVEAISDALDGEVLSRDDLHERLRRRLPDALLPWCDGCKSHHARRGLLVMASLRGRLCIAGRAGRQPAFARTDQWSGWDAPAPDQAGAKLVRRYLSAYGPSTRQHFTQWAGLGTAHGRALWELVKDELAAVTVDGAADAWLLERDVAALAEPPEPSGVHLIAPGDPLLLGRDRESLVPDAAARKKIWAAIGGAGLLLADGKLAGLWRARKQGPRLAVTVEKLGRVARTSVEESATRLAPHRGATEAVVEWT